MEEVVKLQYLAPRSGTKKLSYKRTPPRSLQHVLGKNPIWLPLGVDDSDPRALKRAWGRADEQFEQILEEARQRPVATDKGAQAVREASTLAGDLVLVADKPKSLSKSAVRALCEQYYQQIIDDDFLRKSERWKVVEGDVESYFHEQAPNDDFVQAMLLDKFHETEDITAIFAYDHRLTVQAALSVAKSALMRGDLGPVKAFMAEEGFCDVTIGRKLLEIRVKALSDILNKDQIQYDEITEKVVKQEATVPQTDCQGVELVKKVLSEALEDHIDALKRLGKGAQTIYERRRIAGHFLEVMGDKPTNLYSRGEAVRFVELLERLPARFSDRREKRYYGKPIEELAALKHGNPRSVGTINSDIGDMSALFNWLHKRDYVGSNIFSGLKLEQARGTKKKRNLYTIDELKVLFTAPIYRGCKSLRSWKRPGDVVLRQSARYWVPLIGLFTGLRLGEIIQLRKKDIRWQADIAYIDVQDEDDPEMSLKTSTSVRDVPIHSELIKIGFLEYVDSCSEGWLFPDYTYGSRREVVAKKMLLGKKSEGETIDDEDVEGKPRDNWRSRFSTHFGRFRVSCGVTSDKHLLDFHSLRHNFEDAARNSRVPKEYRDALQGHGESGMGARYGRGYNVETLAPEMAKITYPGLDLSHLYVDGR